MSGFVIFSPSSSVAMRGRAQYSSVTHPASPSSSMLITLSESSGIRIAREKVALIVEAVVKAGAAWSMDLAALAYPAPHVGSAVTVGGVKPVKVSAPEKPSCNARRLAAEIVKVDVNCATLLPRPS
jgi:hypothetical protein